MERVTATAVAAAAASSDMWTCVRRQASKKNKEPQKTREKSERDCDM